jgi:hypothetical protein
VEEVGWGGGCGRGGDQGVVEGGEGGGVVLRCGVAMVGSGVGEEWVMRGRVSGR